MRGSARDRWLALPAVLIALLSAAFAAPSLAQYPERPIHVVTPFPPGGAVDLVTRLVTDRIASDLGRAFVIEAKAGVASLRPTPSQNLRLTATRC